MMENVTISALTAFATFVFLVFLMNFLNFDDDNRNAPWCKFVALFYKEKKTYGGNNQYNEKAFKEWLVRHSKNLGCPFCGHEKFGVVPSIIQMHCSEKSTQIGDQIVPCYIITCSNCCNVRLFGYAHIEKNCKGNNQLTILKGSENVSTS